MNGVVVLGCTGGVSLLVNTEKYQFLLLLFFADFLQELFL